MLLTVRDLKTYFGAPDSPIRAVDGVSFEINSGETFCLVGESGSGKSVTALSIMRLVSPQTSFHPSGSIELDDQNLLALSSWACARIRGRRISMIFQEPMTSLNPVYTVGSQIAEPIRGHLGLPKRAARLRAIEALDQVHIPNPEACYDRYPHELSGGMRQRAMIAMAMACEPDLLIADEPTTALDVTTQEHILELMQELQDRRNMAILFITHDFGVVNRIADRVAVMKEGKIVETGKKDDVLFKPEHDYTQELIASLPANLDRQTPEPVSAETTPLVSIADLQVYYPVKKGLLRRTVDHVKAVDGVDLTIAPGSITALVGESGCGKTTLGKALVRLEQPTEGRIVFEGEDLAALSEAAMRQIRSDIQIIFQDPFASLNPRMMIGDTMLEGMNALNVGEGRADRMERIGKVLEEVQMDREVIHRYPHEFSGGQRQRISIARCLAVEPRFIVCDEITSALDVSIQASILRLLLKLRDSHNLTMLFITHNMEVVEYLADEVAVMYKGKLVEFGPTENVCRNPQHEYTQTLLSAVLRIENPDTSGSTPNNRRPTTNNQV
jgi:peptide/nickel transport system ATP-binding protein